MNVNIRRMKAADAPGLADLWHEMAVFHARCDAYRRLRRNGKRDYADYMREILGAPDKAVFVAHEGGRLVGFALAQLDSRARVFTEGSHGLIQDLAVTTAYRRSGIGTRLVGKSYDWFRKKGVAVVEVRAATANPLATAFWRKMGFDPYMWLCRRSL